MGVPTFEMLAGHLLPLKKNLAAISDEATVGFQTQSKRNEETILGRNVNSESIRQSYCSGVPCCYSRTDMLR